MTDRACQNTLRLGFLLLAVSLGLGVTLEALHGFKLQAYLHSELRRELWRLAHAHGTLLGLLCLVFSVLGERHLEEPAKSSIAKLIMLGSVAMPLGFFLGGVLNTEGDPSFGIVLVPLGALALIIGLVRSSFQAR